MVSLYSLFESHHRGSMVALLSFPMGDRRKEGCHMSQRGCLVFLTEVMGNWEMKHRAHRRGGKFSNGQRPWSPETGLWYSKVPFSLPILEKTKPWLLWGQKKSRKGLTCCISISADNWRITALWRVFLFHCPAVRTDCTVTHKHQDQPSKQPDFQSFIESFQENNHTGRL